MKKLALWGVGLLGVGALAALWFAANERPWSTKDPEVLELVEQAQGELGKLYYKEAVELLLQAQEKAPDSFAVHYFLARAYSGLGRSKEAKEQVEILKSLPQEKLTSREKMLLELLLLRRSGDREAYLTRLRQYQGAAPREVELSRLLAMAYQEAGQPDEAEKWGRHTLELNANDALSYNILGYAELSRGRFAAAEEQFRKYAFIAPDQANPHDSLGELFLITGRYEEAERQLQQAVSLNPSFYPAWRHLAQLYIMTGELSRAEEAVKQLAQVLELPEEEAAREGATVRGLVGFFHRQPALLQKAAEELATPKDEWEYFVLHAASLARGDASQAEKVEGFLEQAINAAPIARFLGRLKPLLAAHRALVTGAGEQALALATQAAARTSYANVSQAWVKLMALCWQAQALAALGRPGEAEAASQEVSHVNPRFPLLPLAEAKP